MASKPIEEFYNWILGTAKQNNFLKHFQHEWRILWSKTEKNIVWLLFWVRHICQLSCKSRSARSPTAIHPFLCQTSVYIHGQVKKADKKQLKSKYTHWPFFKVSFANLFLRFKSFKLWLLRTPFQQIITFCDHKNLSLPHHS